MLLSFTISVSCFAFEMVPISLHLSIATTGCDSISCVCGHDFYWSELVAARHRRIADAFRDAYPEDTGRAAAQIIRRGPPTAADLGAGPQVGLRLECECHLAPTTMSVDFFIVSWGEPK